MDVPIGWSIVVFAAGAVVICLSGRRLPVLGAGVAARMGIGATALGLFILAVITSLPELAVTLAAMIGQKAPELALGNILGSNNFNMTIAVVLELTLVGGVFLRSVDVRRFTRTSWLLLGFTVLVGVGVLTGGRMPRYLPVVLFSLPIVVVFALESRAGGRGVPLEEGARVAGRGTDATGRNTAEFLLHAALVIVAGAAVSWAAKGIAEHPIAVGGRTLLLGHTFVGTLLVGLATSLPEVTVASAAVREARSADMALGTLLGSNGINILLFAIGAPLLILRTGASGWAGLSPAHMVNVVASLVLTGTVFFVMRARPGAAASRALLRVMIPVYLGALYLVYRLGTTQ